MDPVAAHIDGGERDLAWVGGCGAERRARRRARDVGGGVSLPLPPLVGAGVVGSTTGRVVGGGVTTVAGIFVGAGVTRGGAEKGALVLGAPEVIVVEGLLVGLEGLLVVLGTGMGIKGVEGGGLGDLLLPFGVLLLPFGVLLE